jgi:hypothetical protein
MAGDVILFEPPSYLQEYKEKMASNSDLTTGVSDSFPVLSFKGKVWRVKYQGEERIIKDKDGEPTSHLIAVVVKGSPQVSKIYYEGAFVEGSDEPPACYSIDGVKPDPGSAKPQAPACAGCKHNVFGSKITEQGNKTKACADNRRVAVVPYPDIENKNFGGPLLLRVPPASLQNLRNYAQMLENGGANYNMLVTRIGFDAEAAYPKLTFRVMTYPSGDKQGQHIWLNPDELDKVIAMQRGDTIDRMLAHAPIVPEDPAATPEVVEPEAGPGPAPEPEPKPEPKVEVAEAPEPEPKKEKPSAKDANSAEVKPVEDSLNDLIGNLL